MACYKVKSNDQMLLGFEDEPINDKHLSQIGFWTNKIGGQPDWAVAGIATPICSLCSIPQLLVVQVYAPLDDSPFHRTLYVFCCINPNCWNLSGSWTCRRSQLRDSEKESTPPQVKMDWCVGADDWDDDNGNAVSLMNSTASDSDDSSSLSTALGNLRVDQCNANWGSDKGSGAVGKTTASAEIEGDEGEVVTIDSPTAPESDLIDLLEATAPLPNLNSAVIFTPSFIWVSEESNFAAPSDHVRSLLSDYQSKHGEICQRSPALSNRPQGEEEEKYERCIPTHGDSMFHDFIMRLQANPGQILRYCRGSLPLLMSPIEPPKICPSCRGDVVFEMQLLPTLLTKLHLPGDKETHVEFGNVLIYTCEKSCWETSDNFRDEIVCVQAESSHGNRK